MGSWAVSQYVHLSVLALSRTREPSSVAAEALFQFKYASDVTCVDLRQPDIPECISIWSVTAVESPYFCTLVVIKEVKLHPYKQLISYILDQGDRLMSTGFSRSLGG